MTPFGRSVSVLAVVAVLLAACGGGSSSKPKAERRPSSSTSTAPSTTLAPRLPTTVSVPPTPPPGPPTTAPPPVTVPVTTAPTTTVAPSTAKPSTTGPSTTGPSTTASTTTASTEPEAAVVRRTVVYTPKDAPRRKADLVLPRRHRDTMIVLVHGGDGTSGSRGHVKAWADFYARQGYPSMAIDYFLFKTSSPGPVYPKPQHDVDAAVQYVRVNAKRLGVDADRVVVQGFSAGAMLAAQAAVARENAKFVAGLVGFFGRYDGLVPNVQQYYGGSPPAEANAIAQAVYANGPVLLFQGDADDASFVQQAGAFTAALRAANKDVTLGIAPGAGHDYDLDAAGHLTAEGRRSAQSCVDWLGSRFPPRP